MNNAALPQDNLEYDDIVLTRVGGMVYLSPRIQLNDAPSIARLEARVDSCIEEGSLNLALDFENVQQINSMLLEALVEIHEKLIFHSGWIKLSNVNSLVREVLTLTNVIDKIGIIDQEFAERPDIHNHQEKLRIGERLVKKGVVTDFQLQEAITIQRETGRRLGAIILEKGWADEENVYSALAEQLEVPYVQLRQGLYDSEVSCSLDRDVAERLKLFPMYLVRGVLTIASCDPQDMPALREIESRLGVRVAPVIAAPSVIVKTIAEAYSGSGITDDLIMDVAEDFEVVENQRGDDYDTIDEMASGSPLINLVNSIISRAVNDGASDVHIEPGRDKSRVRYRIDGVLYEAMSPSIELHPAIVSRLKVMANLDISERRLPQDGRIQVQTQGRQIDLRFSSLPGLYGEKIVLRVLDKKNAVLELDKLGMLDSVTSSFKRLLSRSYGLVLVTGPTGSGKTTSLYAAINHLNSIEKNIVTIEDPVEYQLDIINQNEVRAGIGLTFAKILKHVLRQDPDIVMVGEIREKETAEIAIQAALTGHLVLSTLHTNDAAGAITRLIDMGVEPFMLSSALLGVMGQRLIRTICPSCKTEYIASAEICLQLGYPADSDIRLAKGRGCTDCYDSGYKGRAGIQEIIEVEEELQQLIMTNPSRDQLNEYIQRYSIKTLRENGYNRVLDRETTIEEVSRVVNI